MENLTELKANFLANIKGIVQMEEMPACLVINWDHMAIQYVLVESWRMAKEGSKRFHWRVLMIKNKLRQCLVPH